MGQWIMIVSSVRFLLVEGCTMKQGCTLFKKKHNKLLDMTL